MNYCRHKLYFALCDFFRTSKTQLFVTLGVWLAGLILAVVFFGDNDVITVINAGRALWKMIVVVLPCYIMIAVATFSKYLMPLVYAAFLYLGYSAGRWACILFSTSVFCFFTIYVVIYLPIYVADFLLMNFLVSELSPYYSYAPKCRTASNCFRSNVAILKTTVIVFAVNVAIIVIWVLIFCKLFGLTSM